MGRGHTLAILVLGIALLNIGAPARIYGQALTSTSNLSDSSIVVVAEDKTVEADCRISVNNGPERPCAPGSVVWTYKLSYAEAKKRGITDFAVLGSDAKNNLELELRLADRVSAARHGRNAPLSLLSCVPQTNKTINQSYTFSTGWRVFFSMTYSSNSICEVFNVTDKDKTDGTTGITWYDTCTDSESMNRKCNYHGLGLSGTWSASQSEQSSLIQRKYQNYSTTTLHSAFGYFYFD